MVRQPLFPVLLQCGLEIVGPGRRNLLRPFINTEERADVVNLQKIRGATRQPLRRQILEVRSPYLEKSDKVLRPANAEFVANLAVAENVPISIPSLEPRRVVRDPYRRGINDPRFTHADPHSDRRGRSQFRRNLNGQETKDPQEITDFQPLSIQKQ
jgi:hypothetical protein